MGKENFEIIARDLSACLKKYETKGFTNGDVLSALEIIVASVVSQQCEQIEALHNLMVFYSHAHDFVDHLYLKQDTNQKT